MEETDVCYPTPAVLAIQQAIPNSCPAKALPPSQRLQIGLQALAQTRTVTALADEFDTSRKFVYQQAAIADRALDEAFAPQPADDEVLFHLPVTKQWLRQLVLGLVLIGHSPLRGVVELLRHLFFDYSNSLGSVYRGALMRIDQLKCIPRFFVEFRRFVFAPRREWCENANGTFIFGSADRPVVIEGLLPA